MKISLSVATVSGGVTNFEHAGPLVRIGRDADCELVFQDEPGKMVSRQHARIELNGAGATLIDAGSSNGTLLNDRKIGGPEPLRVGDYIQLGHTGPTLTVRELEISMRPVTETSHAAARKHGLAQWEIATGMDVDDHPAPTGLGVSEEPAEMGSPRPSPRKPLPSRPATGPGDPPVLRLAARGHFFSEIARGRRPILVLILLGVMGGTGALAYFLIRPKEQYGKYGGIEIGATGIKMFAADFFHNGTSWDYQTLVAKDKNIHLGKRLAAGGQTFEPDALNETVELVKRYFDEISDKYGVPPKRIYVICSSGVFAKFKNDSVRKVNEDTLSEQVRKIVPRVKIIDILDETEKAKYDLIACSPDSKDRANCLLLHVGGGDTKGAYYNTYNVFQPMYFRFGYSSFYDEVKIQKHDDETFDEGARRLGKEMLLPLIRSASESDKGLKEQHRIVLFGAVAWALTTYMHPDELKEGHLLLKAKDLKEFRRLVATKSRGALARSALDMVDEKQREALEQQIEKIQKEVFQDPNQLIAGAEILSRLSSEYGFDRKNVESFRDANYACTIGYIAKTVGIEK